MKRWVVVVVALVSASALAHDVKTIGAINEDDEAAAKRLMKQAESAFNNKDAAAFANVYAENGTFRNAVGAEAKGRKEIQRVMGNEMSGEMKNARFSFRLDSLAKISNDVMTADITNTISGMQYPGVKGTPQAHVFVVLTREGPQWKVAASRGQIDLPKNEPGVGGSGPSNQKKKK